MIAILVLENGGMRKHIAVTVPDPARIQSAANIKRYVDVAAGREIVEIIYPKQAISIRQPWGWGIMHAGKDVENRSRRMCRSNLWYFLHVSALPSITEYERSAYAMRQMTGKEPPSCIDAKAHLIPRGGVIGLMKLGEWVESSESPWFVGPKAIQILHTIPLPFQAGPGKQGVFSWDHDRAELE